MDPQIQTAVWQIVFEPGAFQGSHESRSSVALAGKDLRLLSRGRDKQEGPTTLALITALEVKHVLFYLRKGYEWRSDLKLIKFSDWNLTIHLPLENQTFRIPDLVSRLLPHNYSVPVLGITSQSTPTSFATELIHKTNKRFAISLFGHGWNFVDPWLDTNKSRYEMQLCHSMRIMTPAVMEPPIVPPAPTSITNQFSSPSPGLQPGLGPSPSILHSIPPRILQVAIGLTKRSEILWEPAENANPITVRTITEGISYLSLDKSYQMRTRYGERGDWLRNLWTVVSGGRCSRVWVWRRSEQVRVLFTNRENIRYTRAISQTDIDTLGSERQICVRAILTEDPSSHQNTFLASDVLLTGTIGDNINVLPFQAANMPNILD